MSEHHFSTEENEERYLSRPQISDIKYEHSYRLQSFLRCGVWGNILRHLIKLQQL